MPTYLKIYLAIIYKKYYIVLMALRPQAHIQYVESLCGIMSGIWNQVLPRGLYKSPVSAL